MAKFLNSVLKTFKTKLHLYAKTLSVFICLLNLLFLLYAPSPLFAAPPGCGAWFEPKRIYENESTKLIAHGSYSQRIDWDCGSFGQGRSEEKATQVSVNFSNVGRQKISCSIVVHGIIPQHENIKATCRADLIVHFCGDNSCNAPNETPGNCPNDCPAVCNGDGICESPTETEATCPWDCYNDFCDYDGICEPPTETPPCSDCTWINCNFNAICQPPTETIDSCPSDCLDPKDICNNDDYCDSPFETNASCPNDCPLDTPPRCSAAFSLNAPGVTLHAKTSSAKSADWDCGTYGQGTFIDKIDLFFKDVPDSSMTCSVTAYGKDPNHSSEIVTCRAKVDNIHYCGDTVCDAPAETTANCPGDCPLVCNNNGTCDTPTETCGNCAADCCPSIISCPGVSVGSPISASGLQCLRDATNAKRTNAGLAAFDWKPDVDDTLTPGTTTVKARHFTDLYAAILEVYTAKGQTPKITTPSHINVGQPIKADHFNNLKDLIEQAP